MLHSPTKRLGGHLQQALGINLIRVLGIATEQALLEHFQARDCQPFAAGKDFTGLLGFVRPLRPGTGVEQHGYNE